MTTACLFHADHHPHTLENHVEHAGRLETTAHVFKEAGILSRMRLVDPKPATEGQLLRVHKRGYLNMLKWCARQQDVTWFGQDTYVLPKSYDVARIAAGAALRAVDLVMTGEVDNALVIARPPGHHALPDRAMGFCLLGNAALAARHAQAVYGVEKIVIMDYDVHHGNGTQDVFYDDPGVFYISTHQSPFYPGTGAATETGRGAGQGTTLNIPMRAGYGDDAFARVFERILWPAVRLYAPQLILVSAGFDAHWADPLGGMLLTLSGFDHLSRELIRMAEEYCGGRIIFLLEGGYNLSAIAHGLLNVAYALLGDATVSDPLGAPGGVKARSAATLPPIDALLDGITAIHGFDSALAKLHK